MKRLGNIKSIFGSSCMVITGDKDLKYKDVHSFLNYKVLDKNMKIIGKIISIFGSENQLYFLIKIINRQITYINKMNISDNSNYKIYIKN